MVKHADADCATVSLALHGGSARLVATDDRRGMVDEERRAGLGKGHIGLYSQALRVEAAGGSLTVVGTPSGTTGTVMVPVKGA